jgi:hypothetical protein
MEQFDSLPLSVKAMIGVVSPLVAVLTPGVHPWLGDLASAMAILVSCLTAISIIRKNL